MRGQPCIKTVLRCVTGKYNRIDDSPSQGAKPLSGGREGGGGGNCLPRKNLLLLCMCMCGLCGLVRWVSVPYACVSMNNYNYMYIREVFLLVLTSSLSVCGSYST